MQFAFTEDQLTITGAAHDMLVQTCTPADLRKMLEAGKPRDEARWNTISDMGLIGILAPTARRLMCDISPCGGGRAFFALAADGGLYPCSEFIGLRCSLVDLTPGGAPAAGPALDPARLKAVRLFPGPRALPAFALQQSDGTPLTPDELRGRWTVVFLGFTHCPDVCPTTLTELSQAQKAWDALPAARRRLRLTKCRSCDKTMMPSGSIQKPRIGRKPRTPPPTSTVPVAIRPAFERGTGISKRPRTRRPRA